MNLIVKKEKQMSGRIGGWGWDQFKRRNTYVRYGFTDNMDDEDLSDTEETGFSISYIDGGDDY